MATNGKPAKTRGDLVPVTSVEKQGSLIEVDSSRLEEEWVRQPRTFHKYALKLAEAKNDLANAKADFELVKAELDKAVRARPKKYGCLKGTETEVANTIITLPPYRSAQSAVNNARYNVDILQAAVDTLSQKKSALENLVTLWVRDYYAAPHAPEGAKEAAGEAVMNAAFGKKRK